ncbi:hypothetical protein NFI96_023303, partial [Prochilodus magdalenae]
ARSSAMRTLAAWTLVALLSLLAVKGLGQDFDLSDAFDDDDSPTPHLDLSDFFEAKPTKKPPVPPKDPVKPKPKPDDFDLGDALDPSNDIGGKGKDTGKGGGTFTDEDLAGVGRDEGYKPDDNKGKGGRGSASSGDLDSTDNGDYDTMAETGTIAGIVSAVAMALVGAVSSYISYQKKKFCFSIQQSLNADMVKADNPEAVVAQEPQVQQTLLQPPNAEPPAEDNAV